MVFTDIFIRRPVLASVLSILILVLGIRGIFDLQVRQYPEIENTVITVTTTYPGANASLMQGFVTTPLQKSIASADGIDYMTSESIQGTSTIKAYIRLGFPPEDALTNITGKVSEVRSVLPREINDPVIQKETGQTVGLMYIGFYSDTMNAQQVTDYLTRVVQPKLETVSGVAQAQILGGSSFAMRIWLNPNKLAALGITSNDVVKSLRESNFQSAPGSTKGEYVLFDINADTDLHSAEQFQNIIIKEDKGSLIRLKDVADVKLGAQTYDSSVIFNGNSAVFIGIFGTPTSNPLTVINHIRTLFPTIQKDFPPFLKGKIVYDSTKFIRASIKEVIKTIIEASIIVILVIFLFLGAIRTVMIPMVTIPLSLIGVCFLMLLMGYSLNLLTLLAMVLSIGLVVDDAIVVVENIYRHLEEGMSQFNAAIHGAREIAFPVISMTLTLAAVFAPIGLMGGLTGTLFTEFAFTLAFAVIISGLIALTLSPMMCSFILNQQIADQPMVKRVDRFFENVKERYQRYLHWVLMYPFVVFIFAIIVIISCFFLFVTTPSELAPAEDQGFMLVSATAPQYANIDYLTKFTSQLNAIYDKIPQKEDYFIINGMGAVNNAISGLILKPWDERSVNQKTIQDALQGSVSQIAGLNSFVFAPPPLPSSSDGTPLQFVITSTSSYKTIFKIVEKMKEEAQKSGLFFFVDSDLKFNKPELDVSIDREKAAQMGITMAQLGNALAALLGENYINLFSLEGRSYQVIPQVPRKFRLNPDRLKYYYIHTQDGQLVPSSNVINLSTKVQPNKLVQFQQLNSSTLQGVMKPGVTIGDALTYMQGLAKKYLPRGVTYNYAGQSRQFIQEGSKLTYTFGFAFLIIFLVLAAQFESYRDALIIVFFSVPMSVCGALIPLNAGLATINIYTQVGLLTLIGLISKHGILMVEFANQIQIKEHVSIREAIERAASTRLRPILMTTAATVLGVFPLIIASGAGAVSRFNIGIVIASGMLIGTLFTLFVVPSMYLIIATQKKSLPRVE